MVVAVEVGVRLRSGQDDQLLEDAEAAEIRMADASRAILSLRHMIPGERSFVFRAVNNNAKPNESFPGKFLTVVRSPFYRLYRKIDCANHKCEKQFYLYSYSSNS